MSSNDVAESSQDSLTRQFVQRQQSGGQCGVVFQNGRAVADATAEAGPPQSAVDGVQVEDGVCALRCSIEEFRPVQRHGSLGECGDRQPVPRGDDLVVAAGLRAGEPGGQQCGAHPIEAIRVVRIGQQLQHRAAVFEGAAVGDMEKLCGPTPVVVSENFAQLGRGPHVCQALAPVGVGVQR